MLASYCSRDDVLNYLTTDPADDTLLPDMGQVGSIFVTNSLFYGNTVFLIYPYTFSSLLLV
jgi:hypothetical protein